MDSQSNELLECGEISADAFAEYAATADALAQSSPSSGHRHNTAPTRFVEAGGVRFAYRRFRQPDPNGFNSYLLQQNLPNAELPGERVALPDAEVVDRPDVEPTQLEHQVHLRGPAVDPAHGGEPLDSERLHHRPDLQRRRRHPPTSSRRWLTRSHPRERDPQDLERLVAEPPRPRNAGVSPLRHADIRR
jgi:hypothetical protein